MKIQKIKKEIIIALKGDREIVINCCWGGFGLSHKAAIRYAELKGIKLYSEKEGYYNLYYKVPVKKYEECEKKWYKEDGNYKRINAKNWCFIPIDIERDDEILIQVVKELGEKVNGKHAELKIVKIPFDVEWEIDDYEGIETIEERHRSWS